MTDARYRHVVADEENQPFDGRTDPARAFAIPMTPRNLAAAIPHRDEHEECREDHEHDVLGR